MSDPNACLCCAGGGLVVRGFSNITCPQCQGTGIQPSETPAELAEPAIPEHAFIDTEKGEK